ncbi:substrate-binding domain-containing protein [Nonomuraea sp. K274]|uniref:Substrate-binding domain-containing protein n=1 Tax=Nonomuraea cypriaca TaxID=1187855 RepID=A0A931ABE7_9ACTN|nr:substrate-binding domain-containing protein [Nonomuraea cypriaca]MBF8188064.1 substrate-binding domain-containing protein [Nonomuraea cypriaca]
MTSSPRRATLATVAASAGVSVATVSKVLNGRSDVAPATRSMVESLLLESGYVTRSPRGAEVTVEMHVAWELCAYSTALIKGMLEAGAETGVTVVVTVATAAGGAAPKGELAWARGLSAAGRRAVILLDEPSPARLAALARARLPVVVVNPLNPPGAPMTSIGATDFYGGMSATRHLLDLGHRRIAYLGGSQTAAVNQARMHGYRAAMEAAGVPVLPGYVRAAGFCQPDAVTEGAVLLGLDPRPTAVFAFSDEIALGLVQAARAQGLRIPEDLSVVGFDDTELAALTSPPLTTVRQPLREMSIVALRTALRLAASEKIESHHVELATELVVRESSAPRPVAAGHDGHR